jgi:hypothetical protein
LATCPEERHRDGKRAVEAAKRACELTGLTSAEILDTLAAAYAESGDFPKAVEYQEKAIGLWHDASTKREGEIRLNLYKDRKPYRK